MTAVGEVAARSIDLTRAILELVNSPNAISKVAIDIVQWLARERIDKEDFEYCLQLSRALTFPNENGLQIRSSISKSEETIAKAGGLGLLRSTSIGRWMAFSQDHCYMVTTVAAVSRYHDLDFAVRVLCEMILAESNKMNDRVEYTYSVYRTQLKGVLSKVVQSIALNVVNRGHSLGTLPGEFSDYCVHLSDATTFANCVMKIQRCKEDVLLYCGRFQGDLLLWLMTHFEGAIEVSIAGITIYEKIMGSNNRKLTMFVRETCAPDGNCHERSYPIEISERYRDGWKQILQSSDDHFQVPSPFQRRPLYEMQPPWYSDRRNILNREEKCRIGIAAQAIVKWLMGVSLKPNQITNSFGFLAILGGPDLPPTTLLVGDILFRWPSVTHKNFGIVPAPPVVYTGLPEGLTRDVDSVASDQPPLMTISEITSCFPIIGDLLKAIQPRCVCFNCKSEGSVDESKPGCLREAAVSELFMILGNAIADGFGAQEASGMTDLEKYVCEVQRVFSELIDGFVWWDTWFNLVATTTLGYSGKGSFDKGYLQEGANALAAVQYGSYVVVGRWVDLTGEVTLRGCFGIQGAEGQLPGIQDELAFVQTETGMPAPRAESTSVGLQTRQLSAVLEVDQSSAVVKTAIIGAHPYYRLLTIIESGIYNRLVDPAEAVMGLARSHSPHCDHSQDKRDITSSSDDSRSLWAFDDVLGCWGLENRCTDSQSLFLTKCFESNLKVSVAMSLTSQGCVLRDADCCLECALNAVNEHFSHTGRRIISRKTNSRLLSYKPSSTI